VFGSGAPLAIVVARSGELPVGADEVVAEADGRVLVVGEGALAAAGLLTTARHAWTIETERGLRPGELARALAPSLYDVPLLILPASPDGRDLAPRLAAELDRPLLAAANTIRMADEAETLTVTAVLSRVEGRLDLPVMVESAAVATLVPGVRGSAPTGESCSFSELAPPTPPRAGEGAETGAGEGAQTAAGAGAVHEVEVLEVLEPDPETMDLAEAGRVLAGGAGLVPRDAGTGAGPAAMTLLQHVAAALGASAGATRVVTDAGWAGFERQIGTTGVAIDPDLYVAFGISGASQHTGGLGAPKHIVSVNTDPSCPMTAMADLGLVTDAGELLRVLAGRLGIDLPAATNQQEVTHA
jgi:electron transfer flavoprotein alpha subunit